MNYIFDIDGTVADNRHRLHHITGPGKKNWDAFFDPEAMAQDKPFEPIWELMASLVLTGNRLTFITSRVERLRVPTYDWLTDINCPIRSVVAAHWRDKPISGPVIYMRKNGDRRPSHEVKRDLLSAARADGLAPVMAFDDRKSDLEMFRSEGLIGALLSEGEF